MSDTTYTAGDTVMLTRFVDGHSKGTMLKVVKVSGDDVELTLGGFMEVNVKLDDIEPASGRR